jgi:hypothetical protein
MMADAAKLYGVSEPTLYRLLRQHAVPRALNRADRGQPRVLPKAMLERYCELIAAIKLRTTNRKGRHLSTVQALRLLEDHGVETPDGFIQAPKGLLTLPTINRYLKQWGYGHEVLRREPPAVRFQATHSNDLWQFDLSPSDLKQIKAPSWIDPGKGEPTLMLYSVVDDRSGVAYQEYHCVYGEDVEAALRFLFNAMSAKPDERFPFCGIPQGLYADNGPIARSQVFQQVMRYLGVEVRTHLPQGKDGRRTTARSKGKVERPFRTVKEMHETLYHFHEPQTEAEANAWLFNFLLRYNDMPHRSEPHSRMEDWAVNLPTSGLREMCRWERFCTFAREPERRKVGVDAQVTVHGIAYQVDSDLAGETVILWWGLFDNELYVEHGDRRFGPYQAIGGPIPLHRYRRFKKSRTQERADRLEALAALIAIPRSAMTDNPDLVTAVSALKPYAAPFVDPDPFQQFTFRSVLAAKRAVADYLGLPLAKLPTDQLDALNALLNQTLEKAEVFEHVRQHIRPLLRG